ncbi:hypothetical protein EK904_014981 [Melospiza melodia maxima]|nr:hypothetical protein EK904_014981 [Melospiza melodia maxima]
MRIQNGPVLDSKRAINGGSSYGEEYVSKAASQKYERERHNTVKNFRTFVLSATAPETIPVSCCCRALIPSGYIYAFSHTRAAPQKGSARVIETTKRYDPKDRNTLLKELSYGKKPPHPAPPSAQAPHGTVAVDAVDNRRLLNVAWGLARAGWQALHKEKKRVSARRGDVSIFPDSSSICFAYFMGNVKEKDSAEELTLNLYNPMTIAQECNNRGIGIIFLKTTCPMPFLKVNALRSEQELNCPDFALSGHRDPTYTAMHQLRCNHLIQDEKLQLAVAAHPCHSHGGHCGGSTALLLIDHTMRFKTRLKTRNWEDNNIDTLRLVLHTDKTQRHKIEGVAILYCVSLKPDLYQKNHEIAMSLKIHKRIRGQRSENGYMFPVLLVPSHQSSTRTMCVSFVAETKNPKFQQLLCRGYQRAVNMEKKYNFILSAAEHILNRSQSSRNNLIITLEKMGEQHPIYPYLSLH